jgi:hypothetical protein
MINIALRNTRNYLKGEVDHASSSGDLDTIKSAIKWWNKNFDLDFHELRLRMREVSMDILKSQPVVEEIYPHYMSTYKTNKIYAPMDDDDIFLMSVTEYEKCLEKLDSEFNAVILGIYVQKIDSDLKYKYVKNPKIKFKFHTNNFLFKQTDKTSFCTKWAGAHNRVYMLSYVNYISLKNIETSIHLTHPISVSLLRPKYLNLSNWSNKDHVDTMVQIIENYVNDIEYKNVPVKFHKKIEKYKEIFSDVRPK